MVKERDIGSGELGGHATDDDAVRHQCSWQAGYFNGGIPILVTDEERKR
jgi:hypothetical protein